MTDDLDREQIWKDFRNAVNMTRGELETRLATNERKSVGWSEEEGGESVGHHSGRRIIAIRAKKESDLDDDDYRHMRKVVVTSIAI